ncbi:MAG: xylulokinase [Lachnospiraceae bacterium]|nr:xylulokinase [Lachnospiraceae bacterium]
MRDLLLGIDIGTSSCKVAVFTPEGEVAASRSAEYEVYRPKPGWAEQDPEDWVRGIYGCIRRIFEETDVKAEEIRGIGVDGQSWSAIAVDSDGKVLTNTPIWMDMRSQDICDRLTSQIGQDKIFGLAGNALKPSYTTAKIIWYRENLPEVYEKTDKILQSNSFLVYRLTGEISQDMSQGYGLHCFDMRRGAWDAGMARALGIRESLLPPIFPCTGVVGKVSREASEATLLMEGTPVVAGGLDAACGTLGAGVARPGETQEQGGQAGGMSICIDEYAADPKLILSFHVVPGKWLLQGGTTGGGGTMRWFEQNFADYERENGSGKPSLVQLNEIAQKIAPGSDGLIFLPYMSGERTPIWDPDAKGVFYGLDFSKTKGHFVRSIMEGVAYSLRHNLETAANAGAQVGEMKAMGGSANSLLWTQIKADVTGKRIVVPASDTATTLGAAILGGVGAGIYESCEDAADKTVHVTRTHEPDPANAEVYDRRYHTYLEIYAQLKDVMKERS